MLATPPLPRRRLAALGLLLALVACGGGPAPTVPSATQTVAATTRATAPTADAPRPPAAPATPAPATRGTATPATATATRATALGTPATTVAATVTRGASAPTAATLVPTATTVATPRGYAPGDPCAPYAAGAVPPLGRAAAAPARLCIPALALSAPVVPVGATPEGAMAEAADPWAVGWYAPGPPPGARGNAALAGAVDARGVGPAIFWELDRLRPGDTLIVVDQAGLARRFVVLENAVYLRDDAPLTKVFGPADDANLALITGAGTWEPALGVYDSNRIIFARMQP